MGVFDDKQVKAALARLPDMSTKAIKVLLERSLANAIAPLAQACEAELASRPFEFSAEAAVKARQMGEAVADMTLTDAIRYAFGSAAPASPAERTIIAWIGQHPGTSYEETLAHYVNRDLSLAMGHLVFDRIGCFRRFLDPKEDQSSVLLSKDRSGKSVRYTLKPEAQAVFQELQLM